MSRLKKCGLGGSLKYLPVYLLEVPTASPQPEIWMLEACLAGGFGRYSNNGGYINPKIDAELAHAFSHWSFEASHGRLMVVDLQGSRCGNDFTLTDPAIHCPQDLMRFCDTNFGGHGMKLCFDSHNCGPTCEALGLEAVNAAAKLGEAEEASLATSLNDWIVFD